jgi:predicted ATP-dependent endonuclease of OLD family
MFPEIKTATLIPDVPSVAETLSSVDVQLGDVLTTELAGKGTGVRGAVLVSMLQYLAEQSRRSLILAVEEPEAFLHPAAQEGIQSQLEALARREDVSLLVTTHSPYVISRSSDTLVTELRKSREGVTSKAAVARGSEDRAQLLGSLYRDAGLARAVEKSLMIPSGIRAVIITEGFTDGQFLKDVLTAVGSESLFEGLHFISAGRAANVVPQAILAAAATDLPVIAMLDHDDSGRAAVEKLKSYNWSPRRDILSLRQWPGACKNHDVEIEDLLPEAAVRSLVSNLGEDAALDAKERCGSGWHLRPSRAWKEEAIRSLAGAVKSDPGGMVWLAEELGRRTNALSRASEPRLAGKY